MSDLMTSISEELGKNLSSIVAETFAANADELYEHAQKELDKAFAGLADGGMEELITNAVQITLSHLIKESSHLPVYQSVVNYLETDEGKKRISEAVEAAMPEAMEQVS